MDLSQIIGVLLFISYGSIFALFLKYYGKHLNTFGQMKWVYIVDYYLMLGAECLNIWRSSKEVSTLVLVLMFVLVAIIIVKIDVNKERYFERAMIISVGFLGNQIAEFLGDIINGRLFIIHLISVIVMIGFLTYFNYESRRNRYE